MGMDAHSWRGSTFVALLTAVAALALAACGGGSRASATTAPNPCASPAAGLATLVCNIGTAHTYQDLAAFADLGFAHQGYGSFSAFVTRDTTTNAFIPIAATLVVNGAAATGTYNKSSPSTALEYLYGFNLSGPATVKVSLDPDANPTGPPQTVPFLVQQFSTQGAKIFNKDTGAYYVDVLQGTYNPKTGGEFYVLTLPVGHYVVSVSDCPNACAGSAAAAGYTLAVTMTTAAPNLLFPGVTPVGAQSMPAFGTTDQFHFAFAYAPLSFTGSPVSMTTGPFGMPPAKKDSTGHWLLYGDQSTTGFSAVATVLNSVSIPAATPPLQVFVDVHGPGITGGSLSLSGVTGSNSLAPVNTLAINLAGAAGFEPDWSNAGAITFAIGNTGYTGSIQVTVNSTPQTINLPGTLPSAGAFTLTCSSLSGTSCNSSTASLSWNGWAAAPAAGAGIVQTLTALGISGPNMGVLDGSVTASGSLSATEPAGLKPLVILGTRLQSEQVGDNVILQASKGGSYSSLTPNLPIKP